MAQIINRQSSGELIGRGLGAGVGNALNYLVDKKMSDIKQRHTARALEQSGIDPQKAAAIAAMDPAYGQMFLKNELSAPGERDLANAISAGYGQPQEQNVQYNGQQPQQQQMQQQQMRAPQPQISPQAMAALQALSGQKTPELLAGNPALNQFIAKPQEEAWSNALKNYALEQQQMQMFKGQQPQQQAPQVNPQQQMTQEAQQEELAPLKRSEKMRAAIAGKRLNQNQARLVMDKIDQAEKMEAHQEERKENLSHKDKEIALRETKKYREKLENNAERSSEDIVRNKQLIKLADSGKLVTGKMHRALAKFGLEEWWTNPETQMAESIMNTLATGAAKAFETGRLNQKEVEMYANSLGTLKNTPEGIKGMARIRILMDQANIIRNDYRKSVLRDLKGMVPMDLKDRVDAASRPMLNHLKQLALNEIEIASDPKLQRKFKDGSVIDVNGVKYTYKNKNWHPEGEEYF